MKWMLLGYQSNRSVRSLLNGYFRVFLVCQLDVVLFRHRTAVPNPRLGYDNWPVCPDEMKHTRRDGIHKRDSYLKSHLSLQRGDCALQSLKGEVCYHGCFHMLVGWWRTPSLISTDVSRRNGGDKILGCLNLVRSVRLVYSRTTRA